MFGGSQVIAYLQNTSLELFGEGIDASEIAIFPQGTIDGLTLIDEEKLKQTVISFLAKSGLKKQRVIVVLGESILSEKVVPFTTKEALRMQAESFFASVPFPKENLVKTTLTNDRQVYFIATNKALYSVLGEAFFAIGWKMESVVPITMFGFPEKKLSRERAKQVLKNTEAVKLGNFLLENPVEFGQMETVPETQSMQGEVIEQEVSKVEALESEESASKNDSWRESESGGKKKFLFLPLITIAVGVGFFALLHFHIVYIPLLQKDEMVKVTVKPTITLSPSPKPISVKKEDLKLQVQNGTGTPGQAKLVKDSLTTLGYKTIDTANADSTSNTDTAVIFGSGVSKDDRDAITKELKKTFKNVVSKDGSPESYDIVVVTGTTS